MKRFMQLSGMLLLALVLFSVSAIGIPHLITPPTQPTAEPPPTASATAPPSPDLPVHAIIEYGTADVIKHNNGPLYTYIRYMQAGNPADEVIKDWAYGLYDDLVAEFSAVLASDDSAIGEINIQFDSYLIDNRYVGILESGTYTFTLQERPHEIIKTFNMDLTKRLLLESTDIFDSTQYADILSILHERMLFEHPDSGIYLGNIDESWLSQAVIGHEGIILVLKQGVILPEDIPTVTVTLPYADLGSALLIRTEPPPAAPPGPDQTAAPPPSEPPEPIPEVDPQSGKIDPSKPMIALTFDDGPGIYTDQFLDLFEQYGIRATFCTIGNLVNAQSDALARAAEMGCEVVGHSWDHKILAKLPEDVLIKQLVDTNNIIESVTGFTPFLFRPPYGEINETMKSVSADLGLAMINWTVDSEDWNTNNPDEIYDSVVHRVANGAIILNHETYKSTLEAYKRIIPVLISQGYQFVTVSELLNYTHDEIIPGHLYFD